MAIDETLALRIRDSLACKRNIEVREMLGCICFFFNGNALAGGRKESTHCPPRSPRR